MIQQKKNKLILIKIYYQIDYLIEIIKKIQDDYSYDNKWSDDVLREKINGIIDENIKKLLIDNLYEAIIKISELIGDEILG